MFGWMFDRDLKCRIDKLERKQMDLQTGFNDLKAAIAALVTEENSVVAAIQALRDQINAGTPVTGDQLEALAAQVNDAVKALDTAIQPPAPAPAPQA